MYPKIFLVIIGFCSLSIIHAQVITPTEEQMERKGKHYRFPEFKEADIFRHDGISSKGKLNYNLLTEEIIINLGSSMVAYEPIDPVRKITIEQVDFLPIEGAIYEVLDSGATTLLVHRKQTMERTGQETGLGRTSGTYTNNTNTYSSEPEFLPTLKDKEILYHLILPGQFGLMDANRYYLLQEDKLIPLRRWKQLETAFPKMSDNLKNFIKEEKLKIDREEDLIKAIKFCNDDSNTK